VLDKTGLESTYLLQLSGYKDEEVLNALQEVTGLRCEPQEAATPAIVIDSVEHPLQTNPDGLGASQVRSAHAQLATYPKAHRSRPNSMRQREQSE
jgi:hypothetical protein